MKGRRPAPRPVSPSASGQPAAFEARGLGRTYGKGAAAVHALRGVDLRIPRGEFCSIMGPSGSGKSTLLHLLGLLDAPDAGRLRVLGRDATRLDADGRAMARRRAFGFVFQSFHLLPRQTALQNVMLPLAVAGTPRAQRRARAAAILRSVGLEDRADHRPQEMSGGQKQRVAIARALALDPPILLADEPTGNLDSASSRQVMELFLRLQHSGRTIVQVTHDPVMAHWGSRILHMRDGRIERQSRRRAAP